MSSVCSPIRVLQVVPGLKPSEGGPPASAIATALALRSRGLTNHLAYADVPGPEAAGNAELLLAAGVEIHRFPISHATGAPGVRWGVSPRLAVWLLRNAHRFDVLHMHAGWTFTAIAGLLAARIRGRPAVLTTHESLTDFDRKKSGLFHGVTKRVIRRLYLEFFDLVVMSSRLEQRDSGDPNGRRSVVIPHAVRGQDRCSARAGKASPFRVGFLGRLHPKKNLDLLLKAMTAVDQRAVLVVAGDGAPDYVEKLRSHARELGITSRVIWLGFLGSEEKAAFLSSIDILAMPSQYECFGVASVEAMTAGVPVVVSPAVGIADSVSKHGAGIVARADPTDLAAAITRLVTDRALLQRSRAATSSAAAEFSLESHGIRLELEYQRLLSNGRGRRMSCEESDG